MNKVITINLNGNAYQLEEGGFDALRAYLDSAGRRLEGNPDRDEIVADIEQAIADKFRSLLGATKTVIVEKEVAAIISEMGPVEDASAPPDAPRTASGGPAAAPQEQPPAGSGATPASPKRLYKVHEGALVGGVCNGIAAYLNIDVTIVRVVFAVLMFAYGSGALLYILLMVILPSATTTAEKAAAHGATSATAQEFIRRAREGYYEGMKTLGDRKAHKEWKRRFKREMKGWKWDFRQQMHQSNEQWRRNWQMGWGEGAHQGRWVAYPFVSFVHAVLKILFICCLFTLITSHSVLGIWLPYWMPFWVGILLLIAVYKMITWPMKALLYGHGCGGPFGFAWCALKWVLIIWFIMWLLGGHAANLQESINHLPPKLVHATQSLRDWWNQQ